MSTPNLPHGFYRVLFTIAKNWKKQKCPPIGKWMNKLFHKTEGMLFGDKR
jgi:hypothetical protein